MHAQFYSRYWVWIRLTSRDPPYELSDELVKNRLLFLPNSVEIKDFNYCQTSVLFLYKVATLVDNRAHGH